MTRATGPRLRRVINSFAWAALLLFAPLALRIRKVLPNGFTLPQFIHQRHGRAVHVLYLIQFLGLQICSFAVQILAGSKLIEQVTGLDFHLVALILVSITLAYSVLGGVRASIITDVLQMGLILGIALVTVPMVVSHGGGLQTVIDGLGGKSGQFGNLFDPWIAYSFGIPVTVGLLAGPIGDQMHWQRAYCMRSQRDLIKAFTLGAVLFAIVPITLSLLGFVAAGLDPNSWNRPEQSQLIGPLTVFNLLPMMTLPFCIMLLSGLGSTLDSVLCAVSSLAAVDLAGIDDSNQATGTSSLQGVRTARISMLVAAGVPRSWPSKPAARPVDPLPIRSRSSTVTERPRRASCIAVLRPATPPPITTTSDVRAVGLAMRGFRLQGSRVSAA